jgi:hypothetical protein
MWNLDKVESVGHAVMVNEHNNLYDGVAYWECSDMPNNMREESLTFWARDRNISQPDINRVITQLQEKLTDAHNASPGIEHGAYNIDDLQQVKQGDMVCEYVRE